MLFIYVVILTKLFILLGRQKFSIVAAFLVASLSVSFLGSFELSYLVRARRILMPRHFHNYKLVYVQEELMLFACNPEERSDLSIMLEKGVNFFGVIYIGQRQHPPRGFSLSQRSTSN